MIGAHAQSLPTILDSIASINGGNRTQSMHKKDNLHFDINKMFIYTPGIMRKRSYTA